MQRHLRSQLKDWSYKRQDQSDVLDEITTEVDAADRSTCACEEEQNQSSDRDDGRVLQELVGIKEELIAFRELVASYAIEQDWSFPSKEQPFVV